MFLEQLTNTTQTHMFSWIQINTILKNSTQGRKPKWFIELTDFIAIPDLFTNTYQITIPQLPTNTLRQIEPAINHHIKNSQFIGCLINNELYIGKKKALIPNNSLQLKVTHHKQIAGDSPVQKCLGCHMNQYNNTQHECMRNINLTSAVIIPIAKTTQSSKLHNQITGRLQRMATSPNSITHAISEIQTIPQTSYNPQIFIFNQQQKTEEQISNLLLTDTQTYTELNNIAKTISTWHNISIYTDGSLEKYIYIFFYQLAESCLPYLFIVNFEDIT
jgi:hypothetical protein